MLSRAAISVSTSSDLKEEEVRRRWLERDERRQMREEAWMDGSRGGGR